MVHKSDALTALEPLLRTETMKALKNELPENGWLLGREYAGIILRFNATTVEVTADIPPASTAAARMGLQNSAQQPLGRVVRADPVSAYLNIYAATSYMDNFGPAWQGRQPVNLNLEGALNMGGWVVEAQPSYIENDAHPWTVQNIRMVRDDEEQMVRYQAGELSYPTAGFQNYRPLVGAGFARNFSLQPYLVTQPAGRTSFILGTASTVDVYINGVRQKSLQLQPGVYELDDFPITNGANDVKLIITDASGRVEEKTFPIVSDGNLLNQGLAEFSANAGVPVETINRVRTFDNDHPVFSGLLRYGVFNNWTTGVNLQGGQTRQLGGIEQALSVPWGIMRIENALSRSSAESTIWGHATRLEYRNISTNAAEGRMRDTWQMAAQYRSAGFNTISDTAPLTNPYGLELQGSYGHTFNPNLSFTLGSSYRIGRHNQADDYRTSANIYYRLLPQLTLSLNGSYSAQDQSTMFINLSWMAKDGGHVVNTSYDSAADISRVDWSYRPQHTETGLDTSVQLEKSPEAATLGGTLNYRGNRGSMRLENSRRMELTSRERNGSIGTSTQFSTASALVYSGGTMAVTRPVVGSFAIVGTASLSSNTFVMLNTAETEEGTLSEAKSSWFGPAVLSELTPYVYRTINADVTYKNDMVRDSLVLWPTYKSGAKVTVGKSSNITVSGYLQDADAKPLALVGGQITEAEGEDGSIEPSAGPDNKPRQPILIFTNREGRFQIDNLVPGKYSLIINGNTQTTMDFDVPKNTEDIDLGSRQLDIRPGRAVAKGSATRTTEEAVTEPAKQPNNMPDQAITIEPAAGNSKGTL